MTSQRFAVLLSILLFAGAAFAAPVTFSFTGLAHNTDLGPSVTLTGSDGVQKIIVTAWQGTSTTVKNTARDVTFKCCDSDETGLGIFGATDSEINVGQFMQLDLSLLGSPSLTLQLGFSSFGPSQPTEKWALAWGNGNGIFGTVFNSANTNGPITVFTSGHRYLDIGAASGNGLLGSVTETPEPASLALLISGMAGMGSFLRKKKK